jgi:Spy/CpxP family protein refolding chaperone
MKTTIVVPLFGALLALAAVPCSALAESGAAAAQTQPPAAPAAGPVPMGMGYGAMPGYGMGMMGGPGQGMGMGMGMGMGPGMMGPGMMGTPMPGLSKEQVEQIDKIRFEVQDKMWGLTHQMWKEQEKMRQMLAEENRNVSEIGKLYGQISDLHRQGIETALEAQERVKSLLTPEQREELKNFFGGRRMMGR